MGEASKTDSKTGRQEPAKATTNSISNIYHMMSEINDRSRSNTTIDDIGNPDDTLSDIDDVEMAGTNEAIDDAEYNEHKQQRAYLRVKNLYEEYPLLIDMKISPYKADSFISVYEILGKSGKILKDTKKQPKSKKDLDAYDWVKTFDLVHGILAMQLNKRGIVMENWRKTQFKAGSKKSVQKCQWKTLM